MHAILLGSGLSSFIKFFEVSKVVSYSKVVNFGFSPLEGHERKIYLVKHDDIDFIIMSGKLHYYEGFNIDQISAPIRWVIDNYDIHSFTITSASGGLSSSIDIGQWADINSIVYLPQLTKIFINHDRNCEMYSTLNQKTYAFHQGPSLGTGAEYKMLENLGADLVGMSMLPEVKYLVTQSVKLRLLSLPVCNYYPFENIKEPSHKEVIELADASTISLRDLFCKMLNESKDE